MSTNTSVIIPFSLSVLIHVLLLFLLLQTHPPQPVQQVFEVSLAPDFGAERFKKRQLQLVSPSMRNEKKPPEQTPLRSEADSGVNTQQIKRGDGRDYGPQQPVAKQAPAQPAPKVNPQKEVTPPKVTQPKPKPAPFKKGKLDLSSSADIIESIAKGGAQAPSKPEGGAAVGQEPAPFSRSANQNARFLGRYGDSDYIEGIKEGDITLLNAKAAKYAVFVRRVATRVFHLVKEYGWSYVKKSDYQSLDEYTLVRASMNREGKLVEVRFEQSSGSTSFDDVLVRAVKGGLADPHPPLSAATVDGNIHFIFMARSWSQMAPDRVGVRERRWLLLKTGLE